MKTQGQRGRAWVMRPFWPFMVGAAACSPDLPEPQWFGRYIAFATDEPIRPCAGTLPRMDRFVERTYELFDRTPLQERFTVYYLLDGWEPGFPCPAPDNHAQTGGCADLVDRAVFFQAFAVLEHELVHVIMRDMAGYHNALFEEGTAEALGSRPALFPPDNDDVEDMVGWPRSAIDYTAAGYFVSSLIERHGPRAFYEFYEAGHYGMGRDTTRVLFEQHFGETIEQAASRYRARESQCFHDLTSCDDEPIVPWQGDRWLYYRSPSCDDDDVWGFEPTDEDEEGWEHRFGSVTVGLEIPADGHYEIASTVDGTLRQCGDTCRDREVVDVGAFKWQRPYLRAGRYTLELRATFIAQDIDVEIRSGGRLTRK